MTHEKKKKKKTELIFYKYKATTFINVNDVIYKRPGKLINVFISEGDI